MKFRYHTKKCLLGLAFIASLSATVSCKKFLDTEPEEALAKEQMYRDVYDADAAVQGIYGKLMNLAGQYIVLNELRGDLVSVTANANPALREIDENLVNPDNSYANPKQFYEVIIACNDVLKNFDIMLKDKKFTIDQYNQRYSDIGAIRSWVYLQLGIHFGNVPYVTDPIENISDLKDATKFQKLSFDELLNKLVEYTEALPYKQVYAGTSLITTVDGYPTNKFFINKECLLGDLNLWKGDYRRAAEYYKNVMETSSGSGNDNERYDTYRVRMAEISNNNDLAVGYTRFREQDAEALINSKTQGWKSMFSRSRDALWNTEWIWALPFNKNFKPSNPFIELFSITGGKYLLKPSVKSIDAWNAQVQLNGFPYDARKLFSINENNGKPVVMKYLLSYLDDKTYLPADIFNKEGNWFLYRAATLHLRYAEAANRDNQHKIADALLNTGIQAAYTVPGATDKRNIEQTFQPYPYDFDARKGDFPPIIGNWFRNAGIRGRAYLNRAPVVLDSTISIEDNLIAEAGLELAFEGNRWGDLVRIALRRQDPAFLADKIYQKLNREGNPKATQVREFLLDPKNWYLPFKWE